MTYVPVARMERIAAELWAKFGLEPGFDADQLVDRVGLGLCWEDIDDAGAAAVLGQLDPSGPTVVLNERHLEALEAKDRRLARFTLGHELGHWFLHAEDLQQGTLPSMEGGRVWCRDKSKAPAERQAEMFSACLLMPRDRVLADLPEGNWAGWTPVRALADRFVVNTTPMIIRLEELGWAHRDESGRPVSGRRAAPGQGTLSFA